MVMLCVFAHFFTTKDQGWHFYHDTIIAKEDKPKTMKELKEKAQALLDQAVFEPTPQNVRRYQRVQKHIMDKSQQFATVWTQNLLHAPDLDHTLHSPTSYYGALAKREEQQKQHDSALQKVAKDFGLVLLINDGYISLKLHGIVKTMASRRHCQLMVIDASMHPDLMAEWGVKRVPALLMFHIIHGHRYVVTYGLLAADKIEAQMITNMRAHL